MQNKLVAAACFLACSPVVGCTLGDLDFGSDQCLRFGSVRLASDVARIVETLPSAHVVSHSATGAPTFVRGYLGLADTGPTTSPSLKAALPAIANAFRIDSRDLEQNRSQVDSTGNTHLTYEQHIHGLPVIGGDFRVHVNPRGVVYAAHGLPRYNSPPSPEASVGVDALAELVGGFAGEGQLNSADLAYMIDDRAETMRLVWDVHVRGASLVDDEIALIDAHSGEIVERRPVVLTAKDRRVHNANGTTTLPGNLVKSEGGASSNSDTVNSNFDSLGAAYDCYRDLFGRDSWDGRGATIRSTVNFGTGDNADNAFFSCSPANRADCFLAFGSGNRLFANLASSADVIVHELGHGVTDTTADLQYVSESGALNEAMSDIFAAACQAHVAGSVSEATWHIGEDVWTPNRPNDALRYMNDPAEDGISSDYYPDRFVPPNGEPPGPSNDNGGVHLNSGIANLAFQLLVEGGVHPKFRSPHSVRRGIGIEQAAQIYYRALTTYMNSRTNFENARIATAAAAEELYGAHAAEFVHLSWNAVGVPGSSARMPLLPPLEPNTLPIVRGQVATGLAAQAGGAVFYAIQVPDNATYLRVSIDGGTGDADLYVRRGQVPNGSDFDMAPLVDGNKEAAGFPSPSSGTYYIAIHGFESFSGVTLAAEYFLPGESNPYGCAN